MYLKGLLHTGRDKYVNRLDEDMSTKARRNYRIWRSQDEDFSASERH
jgi:hypothetical protein